MRGDSGLLFIRAEGSFIRLAAFLCLLRPLCLASAQVPDRTEQLRIQVWAELDEFPGGFEENSQGRAEKQTDSNAGEKAEFEALYGYAIERTRQIAPFIMEGLLYGWNFEYTPYDKTRGVAEFWEFSRVREFNPALNRLSFHNPAVKDGKLLSRVHCDRTQAQQREYQRWTSIVYPKVKGTGTGSVEDGFKGIQEACSQAAKNAVREYWRTLIKNKPKEISGRILLTKEPRIYIKSGQYVVDLDFFLETDRIVPYNCY